MWFSGSLKGSMKWDLILSLPWRNGSAETKSVVIFFVLVMINFSVIVLGGGMFN